MEDLRNCKAVDGYTMYCSEEFKALCSRFGIAWDLKSRDMTIYIPFEGAVVVTQQYLASNVVKEAIDTTNQQNTTWKTAIPNVAPEPENNVESSGGRREFL